MRRLASLLLAACDLQADPCFDAAAVVHEPRVLALRVDPPETSWGPGDAPPSIRLRALVAERSPQQRSVDVEVRLCLPQPGVQCADSVAPVSSFSAFTDAIDSTFVVPPRLIEAAAAADTLAGYDGVRVLAELRISSDTVSLRASKLLLFVPHSATPNASPEIDGLEIAGRGRDRVVLQDGDLFNAYVPNLVTPEAIRPDVVELRPILRPGSVEEFTITDLSGQTVSLREHVSYSFFATDHLFFGDPKLEDVNGGFYGWDQVNGGDLADEPEPGAPIPPHGLVRLHGLRGNPNGHLWVVARDGRGGVAWLGVAVKVYDDRCCCEGGVFPDCCRQGDPYYSGCINIVEPLCNQDTSPEP